MLSNSNVSDKSGHHLSVLYIGDDELSPGSSECLPSAVYFTISIPFKYHSVNCCYVLIEASLSNLLFMCMRVLLWNLSPLFGGFLYLYCIIVLFRFNWIPDTLCFTRS